MAKLIDQAKLQSINLPCPYCEKSNPFDPANPPEACAHCGAVFRQTASVEPSLDIRQLQAANRKAKQTDQDLLDAAIALYRRNAGIEEWNEANLESR